MTFLSLLTETVTILRATAPTVDSTNDPIRVWTPIGTTNAYVEETKSTEEVAGRDQVVANWLFILPAQTDVLPYDRLEWNVQLFEVDGLPARPIVPGVGEHHVEARAKWVEG